MKINGVDEKKVNFKGAMKTIMTSTNVYAVNTFEEPNKVNNIFLCFGN